MSAMRRRILPVSKKRNSAAYQPFRYKVVDTVDMKGFYLHNVEMKDSSTSALLLLFVDGDGLALTSSRLLINETAEKRHTVTATLLTIQRHQRGFVATCQPLTSAESRPLGLDPAINKQRLVKPRHYPYGTYHSTVVVCRTGL